MIGKSMRAFVPVLLCVSASVLLLKLERGGDTPSVVMDLLEWGFFAMKQEDIFSVASLHMASVRPHLLNGAKDSLRFSSSLVITFCGGSALFTISVILRLPSAIACRIEKQSQ